MIEDSRRVVGKMLRAPLTRRSVHELLYCGVGGLAGVIGFGVTIVMLAVGLTISASVLGTVIGLLLLTLALRVVRRLGGLHRRLAWWLLRYRVEAPPKFEPGTGILNRLDKRLRDRAAWRGVSYNLVKLPVAAVQLYATTIACIGLVDITYPVDWVLFRHGAGGAARWLSCSPPRSAEPSTFTALRAPTSRPSPARSACSPGRGWPAASTPGAAGWAAPRPGRAAWPR